MKDNQAISLTKQDLPYTMIQNNVFQKMESSKLITKKTIFFMILLCEIKYMYIYDTQFLLGSF